MKIFFIEFEVSPTTRNLHFKLVKGALANCRIKDVSANGAITLYKEEGGMGSE